MWCFELFCHTNICNYCYCHTRYIPLIVTILSSLWKSIDYVNSDAGCQKHGPHFRLWYVLWFKTIECVSLCCFVLVPPMGLLPSMLFRGLVGITVLERRNRYNMPTFRFMIIPGQIVLLCRHFTDPGFWCSNHPVIFSYSCCELVV